MKWQSWQDKSRRTDTNTESKESGSYIMLTARGFNNE